MDDEKYYRMKAEAVLSKINTTIKGLDADEADRRIDHYGKNELSAQFEVPRWMLFISQFKDLLVLVLLAAATVSFIIGSVRDAIIMLIIVVSSTVVKQTTFVQQFRYT